MSKIAHYLQEHLLGEVMTSPEARRYFATDASVLALAPTTIVYPRNEQDIRKTARFCWQLAERGRVVPITPRGSGTDPVGGAIGSGIVLVFPAHMNRIIELDSKSGAVIVEPGINYGKLQQTLKTHGRFLPPYPASLEYSTVGGAVATNTGGEMSVKYGVTRDYISGLKVVLANGEVIETTRLSKRELSKKLGLSTFEGEIYRAVDTLLEENSETVHQLKLDVSKNSAGYDLFNVKNKDGFDLTPLIIGSEGTLGIITEISLVSAPYNPVTTLIVGMFDDVASVQQALNELKNLDIAPSKIEMIDKNLLTLVGRINPNQLRDVIAEPYPYSILLIEFDDESERDQKKGVKKATKILERYCSGHQVAEGEGEQQQLWKLRQSVSSLLLHSDNHLKAVPVIDDGIVPLAKYEEYVNGIAEILKRNHLVAAVWGHAGEANLHLQPHLDLSQVGDRQKLFRLMDEYYDLVIGLGGSPSAEHGDGRMRGPYLEKVYGPEAYVLFQKLKQIFDPYSILNPGVKINVTLDDIKPMLRQSYELGNWFDHLPRA